MSALDTQVGGSHYKDLKIQPMQYSMANKLDACQHTIIKYVTRFRAKGGIADLEKARHCIDMLIEFEKAGVEPEPPIGEPLKDPAKIDTDFDESRMDVIGQNGNDGEHYQRDLDAYTAEVSSHYGVCAAKGCIKDRKVGLFCFGHQGAKDRTADE